jgi:hypothetical protein
MKQNETLKARHVDADGKSYEFNLVATALKRQAKDEPTRYYPWFSETESTYDNMCSIFSSETMEEYALEGLNRDFQLLYNKANGNTQQFLESIKDANLSSRQITVEYCMRKAANIIGASGPEKKKWTNVPQLQRTMESMKWIQKAQELGALALANQQDQSKAA